jgi:hypothetical protein
MADAVTPLGDPMSGVETALSGRFTRQSAAQTYPRRASPIHVEQPLANLARFS